MSKTIGTNVAFFRRKKGLTQRQLADKTNLSVSFISHIENNISKPSSESMQNIAKVLGVSVSDLEVDAHLQKLKNEDIELIKLLIKLTIDTKIERLRCEEEYCCYSTQVKNVTYNLRYSNNYGGDIDSINLEIYSDDIGEPNYNINSDTNGYYNIMFKLIDEIQTLERDKSPVFRYMKDLEDLDNGVIDENGDLPF